MKRPPRAARAALAALAVLVSAAAAQSDAFRAGLALKKAGKFKEAAAEFRRAVDAAPDDAAAVEQLATVQGWSGAYDAAVASWRRALVLRPKNVDDTLGLARVLYWKGEHEASLDALADVLALEPRSVEALVLRGDVLAAAGRADQARASYLAARELAPNDESVAKRLARAVEPTHWRLDVGYTGDKFTRQRAHEYEAFGQLGYEFVPGTNLWARHDVLHNFDQTDHTTQIGGAARVSRYLLLLPSVGGTPRPHFRPVRQADGGVELQPCSYFAALFDYRYFRYPDGDVRMLIPGVRVQPFPLFALEYRYALSRNADLSKTSGYSVRADFYLGDEWAPYVAYAHGLEDLPPLASAKVSYYSGGVAWNAARNWGVRLDYANEDRAGFYKRRSLGAAVTLKR